MCVYLLQAYRIPQSHEATAEQEEGLGLQAALEGAWWSAESIGAAAAALFAGDDRASVKLRNMGLECPSRGFAEEGLPSQELDDQQAEEVGPRQ